MTLLLLDVSRWQAGLDLARARDEGFTLVNVQLSGKAGYVFPDARARVDEARALGMGVCVYHWLDGRLPGAVQAEQSWRRILDVGGPQGLAHQVDCEDTDVPATWPIWRDYVRAMQDKLGRPVVNYSGDWWWEAPERRWPGAEVTPYHWAAPNRGYPGFYPGDDAAGWRAGYGGWGDLAVMQYAVADVAGVRCSLSAVRFHRLWTTLTGGEAPMTWRVARGLDKLLAQINEVAPGRSKASDGSIGNDAHCDPNHPDYQGPSDHCAKVYPELGTTPVVLARDFTHDPGHGADMHEISEALRLSRDRRIKYVIFNRRIFSATTQPWVWRPYTGSNPHDKHMHVSVVPTSVADDTSEWEITMPVTNDDVNKIWGDGWEIAGRTPGRTGAGTLEALLNKSDALLAAAAADVTRDNALAAAVQALAAGGTNVDTAVILARVDEKTAETNAAVEAMRAAHQAELDALQAELDAARQQLAAVPAAVIAEIAS